MLVRKPDGLEASGWPGGKKHKITPGRGPVAEGTGENQLHTQRWTNKEGQQLAFDKGKGGKGPGAKDNWHVYTSTTDYYAFGQSMPGRTFAINIGGYKYGMNGKEKDDEISGSGNMMDFGAREYDARLGRWWAIDSKYSKYPEFSPYVFGANSPIYLVDADGNDIYPYHITGLDETGNSVYTKGQVSAKTEAVIKDMLKTPEGMKFFSQFAKKGQTLAGHTFTEDGALNNHDLSIFDYSLENLDGNLPSNVEGSFGADYNPSSPIKI